MKIINFFFPVFDFVYLFQQEEYSFQRFNFWFWRFFFRRNLQQRDKLVFTNRARILIFLTFLLFIILNLLFFSYLFLTISVLLFPFFVVVVNLSTFPIFSYLQNRKIKKAKEFLDKAKNKDTKVIAIVGSFGKTTTKNILVNILKTKYRVGYIEGNINTPLGVANWFLYNFNKNIDIFICEVDGYSEDEYKNTISILNPDITVLTNIGDQHLQRFGSKENLAKSLIHTFSQTGKNILLKKYLYYLQNLQLQNVEKLNFQVADDIVLNLSKDKKYLEDNFKLAVKISKDLGVKDEYTEHILKNFEQVDRRGNISKLFGFETLDSSYNISFTTGNAILEEAAKVAKNKNKKLLVAFAGIPELADSDKEKNTEFARMISETVEDFVFFKSIFISDMLKGVGKIDGENIVSNFKEFESLVRRKYSKEEYFILLFPELTDIYY